LSIKFNTTDVGLVIVLALIVLTPKPTSVKTTVLAYSSKSQGIIDELRSKILCLMASNVILLQSTRNKIQLS
jgi:hypothetical protein